MRAAVGPGDRRATLIPLAPGETVTLDTELCRRHGADIPGATDGSRSARSRGSTCRALLISLDRYPYGCAEQISSRALPLLYLNEVAQMIGLGDDDAINQRDQGRHPEPADQADLERRLRSLGSVFEGTDLWLDSYVTEFLLRAKAEGLRRCRSWR